MYMFLCIDPGSRNIGFTLIDNFKIIAKGVLEVKKGNIMQELTTILEINSAIHTVLIEKGENLVRDYEKEIINLLATKRLNLITYQAKPVRKKLKLERHPSVLGIKAKEDLVHKIFPDTPLKDLTVHELDSALLYIYHQRYGNVDSYLAPLDAPTPPQVLAWKRDA